MNLRQIEIFLSVVEHGGFSAAARGSLLTQSTISQHIAALEQELGLQLLERSRNGVILTEAGRLLQRHARRLVGELQATEAAFRRLRGLEDAELRLGASSIPAGYLVPPVLARLCERFPNLRVALLHGDSQETLERVSNREIEVGVVGSRLDEKNFAFASAGEDHIVLVARPDHAWAGHGPITKSALLEAVFLGRESGSGTGRAVREALRDAGLDPRQVRVRAELGSAEAMKAGVLAGLGIAFLSDLSVRRELDRGDLVVVPITDFEIVRRFHLVKHSGRELSPASAAFWELMARASVSPA